MYLVGCRTNF